MLQQMLVHKGSLITNVQLITGVGSVEMYVTPIKLQCQNIQRALHLYYNLIKKQWGGQM